ncbi:MAG TPA: GyrI-like domain-containing protein [Spirochaetota bacterium]|nr:GyrI-like domain-containing protein [Spirochaetota bacterium]HPL15293.1 GyrI-like domain-containing protein [Spirochaetota bacterium]
MKKVIIVFAVLVAAVLCFMGYSGIFSSVVITEKEIGPFTMVVKKHTGSYYKTGAVFDEVEKALKKSVDTKKLKGVGLYYDDPAKVKEEQLRSECGFIIEKADLEKLGTVPEGLIVKDFKKTLCAVGEFPLTTFLSYMIGPARVYPKIEEFGKKKKLTGDFGMELYDHQSGKIVYCMPVAEKK